MIAILILLALAGCEVSPGEAPEKFDVEKEVLSKSYASATPTMGWSTGTNQIPINPPQTPTFRFGGETTTSIDSGIFATTTRSPLTWHSGHDGVVCRLTADGRYERGEKFKKMRCRDFKAAIQSVEGTFSSGYTWACWRMDRCSHRPRRCR